MCAERRMSHPVSQFHLNRIVSVCQQADMAALVVARAVWTIKVTREEWKLKAFPAIWHKRVAPLKVEISKVAFKPVLSRRVRAFLQGFIHGFGAIAYLLTWGKPYPRERRSA